MSDANRTTTGAAQTAIVSDPTEPVGARPPTLDEHRLRQRLIGAVVVTAAIASLLVAVPVLRSVAKTISHMSPGWLVLALGLELASSASFVVIFRLFFPRVPSGPARELA